MALSLRRADSVRAALIAGGVAADAITVAGRGESEPAVPTADGRSMTDTMDTLKIIDQLEIMVEEEKMKFMGFVRLDEDQFFQLTSKLRASLPEDVRRAGKLAENTDRIMERGVLLPLSPAMDSEHVAFVTARVATFLAGRR